jgi:two-component system LytT family sensor kinase
LLNNFIQTVLFSGRKIYFMKKTFFDWYSEYKIHILVWILYISYEMISVSFAFRDFGNPIIYVCHYAVFIFFFYIHAKVTLPIALKNKNAVWWLAPLLLVIQTVCFIVAQYSVSFILVKLQISKQLPVFDLVFFWRNAYRAIFFAGFSTGYYLLTNYLSARKKSEQLEKDRLNTIIVQERMEKELTYAQNAFLKAQINPHLLFNTLDFIYHKVNTHSETAGEAVIKLSEMMRFAIDSDLMEGHIDLADEFQQVENLIYLYQLRSNQQLYIDFSYTKEAAKLKFIPLILLTLVENMFKHGDLRQTESEAQIAVFIDHEILYLNTSNRINHNKALNSSHTGLINSYNRLVFAYTDQIELHHHVNANNEFIVNIGVPIKYLS